LLALIEQTLAEEMVAVRVHIPYRANELVALFHQRGIVTREEFTARGTLIEGRIARNLVARLARFRV
jgi:GTP-binding protein HflX